METQRGQIRTMIPDKIMNLKAYGMIENYETKDFPGEITMTKMNMTSLQILGVIRCKLLVVMRVINNIMS